MTAVPGRRNRPGDHYMCETPEYKTWSNIKRRCLSPTCHLYWRYGAAGIGICEEWAKSFQAFFRDMGKRPEGTSIDRINNSLGYSASNCRWATAKEQQRNKSDSSFVSYQGREMTKAEYCELIGLVNGSVNYRLSQGFNTDEIAEIAARTAAKKAAKKAGNS